MPSYRRILLFMQNGGNRFTIDLSVFPEKFWKLFYFHIVFWIEGEVRVSWIVLSHLHKSWTNDFTYSPCIWRRIYVASEDLCWHLSSDFSFSSLSLSSILFRSVFQKLPLNVKRDYLELPLLPALSTGQENIIYRTN